MQSAVGSLAGRTVFITGASRGIGKAIALRCAADGANVVIAAKTVEPHPKLPGTIYTAAEEIEKAGGKCLPCIVDIRYEDQIQKAVDEAVRKFGGIDVLVNNASAITTTGTAATSMKKYDLMHGVNTRGTFLCSKLCYPVLKGGKNPHILNISPPLSMKSVWFADHVAYTMAKFGMSMCVLGMADEFKSDKIAVNALWPKTAIYTAALDMLAGGPEVKNSCRSPEIMADSAHAILTRDSSQYSGNFYVDEEILRENGITDFMKYQYTPDAELLPDFFLEGQEDAAEKITHSLQSNPSSSSSTVNPELEKTFQKISSMMNEELVQSVGGVFHFNFKEEGEYYLDLKNGAGAFGTGPPPGDADVVMTLTGASFLSMALGKLNPTTAFMSGKLKIKGNLPIATKLEKVLKKAQAK